jgi:hypothetical protein
VTARRRGQGVSLLEHLEALVANPVLYRLGELIPEQAPGSGGRPRHYPGYAYVLYAALVSVYTSTRKVETEFSHPDNWANLRRLVRQRFPNEPSKHLPERPMRRHHFVYVRDRYLTDEATWDELRSAFTEGSAAQAVEDMGMCRSDGPGSLTHPDLSRMLYADGKVITPVYKAKPGQKKVDRATGEVRELRADPDAHLHITGGGEPAYGNKFVMVSCRTPDPHGRMILDLEWVPDVGGEAKVALHCLGRVAPCVPAAQGVLYDGAFRGVHLQEILHHLGLVPVVPVTAASGGKRARKPREERTVRVEQQQVTGKDGVARTVQLYARAGALGVVELDDAGEPVFTKLERRKLRKCRNADGTWRFYGEYRIPDDLGGGDVRVRLDQTDEDRRTKFNRTEHLRPFPPSDGDYKRLYPRRADAESINRALDDSMWLGRAHSVGAKRQLVDLLGFAMMINSLALHRRRSSLAPPGQRAA